MLLISQLAFHPMFKISTIHQHTSFNPNHRSRRSLGLRRYAQSVICRSMRALGRPLLKQLRCKFVQSKRFSSFAGELSHNSQWSIPYNEVQNFNKFFNFFSKRNLRGFFMTLLEITKKSPANNYKHYRKLIQWVGKRSDNKQVSFKNAADVCSTSGLMASLSFSKTATALRTR